MEQKTEQPIEPTQVEKPAAVKKRFDFMKWLQGDNRKEYTENLGFLVIVVSGVLVALGIGLGSFVQGTIIMGILGSFFMMLGIIIYIVSQFIEV